MGRPVHFEIHADDPERAVAFYRSVFGWRLDRWGEEPYWLATTGEGDGGIDGAITQRVGRPLAPGDPVNGATLVVAVADIDAWSVEVVAAGGSLVTPKAPVPGVGWVAYGTDTEGNLVCALQQDTAAA